MCEMDFATNATHPVYVIPWSGAGPGACEAFILERYKHLYHCRNPQYTFLVATAGDEIIGYLLYSKPPGEEQPEEWIPALPHGTNVNFFDKVFGQVKAAKKKYDLQSCWGRYRY